MTFIYSKSRQGTEAELQAHIDKTFKAIQRELESRAVREVLAPPGNPFPGMIVLTNAVNWNPGSGTGAYVYYLGTWRFLG